MELRSDYPISVLRTLWMCKRLADEIGEIKFDMLCHQLCQLHSKIATQMAVDQLVSSGLITLNGEFIRLSDSAKNFDWVDNLIGKDGSVLVLGFPGSNSMTFADALERNKLSYVDHDVAWNTLINRSERSLRIISPFMDTGGIELFGKSLINALKRGIDARIIARSFDQYETNTVKRGFAKLGNMVRDEAEYSKIEFGFFHDGPITPGISRHLGSVHAKLIVQDAAKAYVGSGEFRLNSAENNLEIGFLHSRAVEIQSLITVFDVFWELCQKKTWRDLI